MRTLKHYHHSISIDEDLCVGCVKCTLACPVQAIRVRDGKAVISRTELCVECGECLRVCPYEAVKSMTTKGTVLSEFKVLCALPSPVLYSQFGDRYSPNDILLGLRKIGFDYVFDLAVSCERVLVAIAEYLKRTPSPRPMISNFCPAATRLIIKNYPHLIDQIIPIEVPREIAAKRLRRRVVEERGVAPEEVGIFNITPCAAKMASITRPVGIEKSNLDGAIAIRDLYVRLKSALEEVEDDWILQNSSGVGISWSIGRASHRALPSLQTVSVTGVNDVIRILDDVEAERLRDVDYLECSVCPDGCVGGPLVVQNKHLATSRVESLIEQYGVRSRVDPRRVLQQYEEDYLLDQRKLVSEEPGPLDTDFMKALKKMKKIEEFREMLPGKQCGACGSPSCEALAEDVVRGEANLSDCVFVKIKELKDGSARGSGGFETGDTQ
jgi:iron only hydrogenase large subunit-like protein